MVESRGRDEPEAMRISLAPETERFALLAVTEAPFPPPDSIPMSDTIDGRLEAALAGRYEIERPLGEGGMATVYLAEDVKHQRKVALKVLKPELAAVVGGDRFLTEIQTTANLSHPHILPLHDSGEADSFLFYVMPYVDGESLRDRLDRERQLPVDEAVRIAIALAGALDHAHKRGVIHRDIKPANVLLQDGQPLMADFGIALAVGAAGGARLTETGLSVGTPYYMSPEQATGDQVIGPASDIYALACVLYEMLVGEPPYPGATAQAVLGKIISGEAVSATKMRPAIPANVDAAIRRGLEKLAADRFATVADFAAALADPSFRHGASTEVAEAVGAGPWKARALVLAGVAAALAAITGWSVLRPVPPPPVSRYAIELPEGHDVAQFFGNNITLSPDGTRMVYSATAADGSGQQLWLRRRDQLEPQPIGGTEGAFSPAFSPSGDRVAYVVGQGGGFPLRVVSLSGEPPITVLDQGSTGSSVAWGADDYLYFDGSDGLLRVPVGGGEPETVTTVDTARAEQFHAMAQVLPDGKGLLFSIARNPAGDLEQYDLAVTEIGSGTHTVLTNGVYGLYAASGHLVYVAGDGTLLAAPMDPGARELTGPAVALAEGVGIGAFGSADMAISDDGTLVYGVGGTAGGLATAVWVDREGEVTPIESGWEYDPGFPEVSVELSPDGSRLALMIVTDAGHDIWVKELDGGGVSRLTFDDATDHRPRWSRDGQRIMYNSTRAGQSDLWVQPADGTGSPEMLLDLDLPIHEVQISPDEEWFILRLGGASGSSGDRDLVGLRKGETTTVPLAAEPYDEKAAALSPDGRWLAYESTETGRNEIYVRPFPNVDDGKWLVSTGGGINPRWAHSGQELFYVNGDGEMVTAQLRTDEAFRVGERRTLFSVNELFLFSQANYAGYSVAPDDQAFVMVQFGGGGDAATPRALVVVENFFEELEEKVQPQ
jgi:serine/threonine-protein kinase